MVPQALYRINSTGAIYLFLFNEYWYVTNTDTLNGVFGSNPEYSGVTQLPGTPQYGPEISAASCLFQPTNSSAIYFMCASNLTAYLIANPDALQYYQFNGPIQTTGNQVLSDWLMALTPQGDTINYPG